MMRLILKFLVNATLKLKKMNAVKILVMSWLRYVCITFKGKEQVGGTFLTSLYFILFLCVLLS